MRAWEPPIGDAKDHAAAGAVIGSAVGALAGAAAGSGLDAVQARNDAIIQQHLGRQLTGTTTLDDVVAMSRAGLGDEVIIQHVRNHGVSQEPTASDLIVLKQQGVSDLVMRALQDASSQPPAPAVVPSPAPVYVEQSLSGATLPGDCAPSTVSSRVARALPVRPPPQPPHRLGHLAQQLTRRRLVFRCRPRLYAVTSWDNGRSGIPAARRVCVCLR